MAHHPCRVSAVSRLGRQESGWGLTFSCPPLGGTHLGLHEEGGFHPGLRPSLADGPLELRHRVSLLRRL